MRLALFEPDQPGNVGAAMRLGACLGVPVDVIRPAGFPLSEPSLRRAAMDYAELADVTVHDDWDAFRAALRGRLVLLTAAGATALPAFAFQDGDTLLMGSESGGAPPDVHGEAAARVRIPVAAGARSLNMAVAAGIALGAALGQLGAWPQSPAT